MSEFFKGTVLADPVVVSSSGSTYATHHSIMGSGGYREVTTIAERNAIPVDGLFPNIEYDGISSGQRRLGMLVHVFEDDTIYQLHPKVGDSYVNYSTWLGYTNTEKYLALSANTSWYPLYDDTDDSSTLGSNISREYSQTTHGFVIGDVIGHNGTEFVKVSSESANDVEPLGVVSISDYNGTTGGTNTTFTLTYAGFINALGFVDYSGNTLSGGTVYYLAPSGYTGKLTPIQPTGLSQVSKPMLVKTGGNNAIVLQYRGRSRTEEGVTFGDFLSYSADTEVYLNKTVTGATNIGFFSGTTGQQILDILTAEPLYNGYYLSEYNYYYRDINGVIQLGSATYNGDLRRGYVSMFTPAKSWIYNYFTGSSNQVGWILVDGDISENVGEFLTANPNSGTVPFTDVEWWTTGGTLNDGYYANSAISFDVLGDVHTGDTYIYGGPVYRDKRFSELRLRTVVSQSPDTIVVSYDDNFIYISGQTSGNTITGVTGAQNIGTGYGVYSTRTDDDLLFRSLIPSGYTTMTYSGNSIVISSSNPTDTVTGVTNIGSGEGLFSGITSYNIQLKSILGSGGTSIYNSGDTLVLHSSSLPSVNNGLSVSGDTVVLGGTLTGDTEINLNHKYLRLFNTDNNFSIGTGFNDIVYAVEIQSDGKILIGGNFTTYSGVSKNYIVRLNSDGSIDDTFTIGTGFNGFVRDIKIQSDGKILIGGNFTSYSGVTKNNIVRLNLDGTIDNAFTIGTGFNSYVNVITLQDDGKILVGGQFSSYNGTSKYRLIRLNTDGTVDNTTFTTNTGFNGSSNSVNDIAVQDDGKIVVGSNNDSYSGATYNRIIRLNSDGTIDTSFVIGTGFNQTVESVEIQDDGKILVGGNFTSYSGVSRNYVIRLNSDGSIDNTFNIGTGFSGSLSDIEIQDDGKILVGGNFTSYSGVSRNYVIRLNSDGSVDNIFNIGTGFNGSVNVITLQDDGKILVGGGFTLYSGVTVNRFIKLNSDGSISVDGGEIDIKFNVNGVSYNKDLSSNFTARSLPDVAFITGITSQIDQKNNIYSTTIVTGSTTLTSSDTYLILVNSSAVTTINLPASPLSNQAFKIKDASGTALSNNITVSGNTKLIDASTSGIINTNYGAFELIYNQTLDKWLSLSVL